MSDSQAKIKENVNALLRRSGGQSIRITNIHAIENMVKKPEEGNIVDDR